MASTLLSLEAGVTTGKRVPGGEHTLTLYKPIM